MRPRPTRGPAKLTGQRSCLGLYKAHENPSDDSGALGEPRSWDEDKGLAAEKQARDTFCVGESFVQRAGAERCSWQGAAGRRAKSAAGAGDEGLLAASEAARGVCRALATAAR